MNYAPQAAACDRLPVRSEVRSSLSVPLLDQLNRQLNHELYASHSYLAMSAWCDSRHLAGLAGFFRRQSVEETEHAMFIFDHLQDRGAVPVIGAVEAPRREFESLVEVAEHAQALETGNTRGIHEAYQTAMSEGDYPTQVALQTLIQEQVEEEKWAGELVAKAHLAGCCGAMLMLDHRYAKRAAPATAPSAG
jgi:ferritin